MENKEKYAIQEMDETTKRREKEKLSAAVDVVNAAIRKYREELEKLVNGEENEPILIEGETSTGFYCQMMVDPKHVAKIILSYDYPILRILGEEAPDEMWEELGQKFGLEVVSSFDL